MHVLCRSRLHETMHSSYIIKMQYCLCYHGYLALRLRPKQAREPNGYFLTIGDESVILICISGAFWSISTKTLTKTCEARSNIDQNDLKCLLIVISGYILVHFSHKVDQKLKINKSEAKSSIAQNGQNLPPIVISSHILEHF